jgi:hypothetical protein
MEKIFIPDVELIKMDEDAIRDYLEICYKFDSLLPIKSEQGYHGYNFWQE